MSYVSLSHVTWLTARSYSRFCGTGGHQIAFYRISYAPAIRNRSGKATVQGNVYTFSRYVLGTAAVGERALSSWKRALAWGFRNCRVTDYMTSSIYPCGVKEHVMNVMVITLRRKWLTAPWILAIGLYNHKPFQVVLPTLPPHTYTLVVSIKKKAGLIAKFCPLSIAHIPRLLLDVTGNYREELLVWRPGSCGHLRTTLVLAVCYNEGIVLRWLSSIVALGLSVHGIRSVGLLSSEW